MRPVMISKQPRKRLWPSKTYRFIIPAAFAVPRFLFNATELSRAAFLSSFPPANLCLAQTPMRQAFVLMFVVGVAYGLLSLDVTSSSRNLRFLRGTCLRSSLSESSGILDLLSRFRDFDSVLWGVVMESLFLVVEAGKEDIGCADFSKRFPLDFVVLESIRLVPIQGTLRSISNGAGTRHSTLSGLYS